MLEFDLSFNDSVASVELCSKIDSEVHSLILTDLKIVQNESRKEDLPVRSLVDLPIYVQLSP